MSRYPSEYLARHVAQGQAARAGTLQESLKPGGHDDRDSQSPSDDGSAYVHYSQNENELEEDPNASLIAQTLNTDGTPKRPMNAFMIFARRRRPQVSAENQAMRTGEISKILSKEWNAMELADKQFYLDQAKQLKDIFNSRYPDYVYRRRPNNSRRKRGTTAGSNRTLDHAIADETGLDGSGNTEFDDFSAVDGEDLLTDVIATNLHTRMSADTPSTFDTHLRSSYGYPSSDNSYQPGHGRSPYPPSGQQRHPPDVSPGSSDLSRNVGSALYQQSYLSAHRSQPPPLYASERDTWSPIGVSGGDHSRTIPADWMESNGQLLENRGPDKSHHRSPTIGQPSWGRPTSPTPLKSAATSSPAYHFPTLNSPFYPNHSQTTGNYANPTSPGSAPAYHHPSSGHGQGRRPSSAYGHRSYALSPPPPSHYPSTSNRDPHMYQQHQSQPPSVQSMLPIPHVHTSSPTGSGLGTPGF